MQWFLLEFFVVLDPKLAADGSFCVDSKAIAVSKEVAASRQFP